MIADHPASTKEGKCLKSCMMKKFSTMNDSGKMSLEGAMHVAHIITKDDEEQMQCAEKIIKTCNALEVSSDQ